MLNKWDSFAVVRKKKRNCFLLGIVLGNILTIVYYHYSYFS